MKCAKCQDRILNDLVSMWRFLKPYMCDGKIDSAHDRDMIKFYIGRIRDQARSKEDDFSI